METGKQTIVEQSTGGGGAAGEESDERHAEQMRRRKASYDARKASATNEKGLIIVNTGAGKGKTSAALGMIFRALGHSMRVGVVQFTKGAIETGEAAFARQLEGRVDFYTLGEGYTWETQDRQRDTAAARRAWERARMLLEDPQYQIVVLDGLWDGVFAEAGGFVDCPVYDRYALAAGTKLTGPAIVEERESTTVLPPGVTATVDECANLVAELPRP